MKYSVDKQDRYTVFQLQEDNLNSVVAPDLKSEIVILHNEGVNNLIFDLSNVKYVDSSGLSAILTADRLMKTNGSFVLTGIEQPAVKKLFEISRLDSVLSMAPTKQEAVEYVFMEELQRELEAEGDDGDEEDEDE
jgi:anti-sigma B factor antagonist